jgi:hypothetical protein
MESNKKVLLEKISWLLAGILVIAVTVTVVIDLFFHPMIDQYKNNGNTIAASIILIICVILLFVLTEKVIGKIVEFILCMKKGELHGWWMYCFLFPAKEYDIENMVCFSINKDGTQVYKVLVVGFLNIFHDSFELSITNDEATSKTFKKHDKTLSDRVDLKIKNLDFRNKDIIIIYKTTDATHVPIYKGIMDFDAFHDTILVKKPYNKANSVLNYSGDKTLRYIGLIQDLEASNILGSSIYAQQLKYEKTKEDVENVLQINAEEIIKYFQHRYHASLI